MQSKKIIAGTMALLMAFGSVAGSVDGIFASNAIVANAYEVKKDATAQEKLDYIGQVIGWTAERISDNPGNYGIDGVSNINLVRAINSILSAVNGIDNLEASFGGEILGGYGVGAYKESKDDYNVTLGDYSASTGDTMTGKLTLKLDGISQSYDIKITIPAKEVKFEDVVAEVAKAMDEFEKTITPSTVQADFDKIVDDILAKYSGYSRVNTSYKKDGYWFEYEYSIKKDNTTSDPDYTKCQATEDSRWADLMKRVKEAIPEAEVKAGASDDEVVASIEKIAQKLCDEWANTEDSKTTYALAEVTERTGYKAPTETTSGSFSGKLTVTEYGGNNRKEVIDFTVELPANPKDDETMIKEINEKLQKALKDYKYTANKSTTVDDVVKFAQAKAEELGATLTYNGNNKKGEDFIEFEYTLAYKTATLPKDVHADKLKGYVDLLDAYGKYQQQEAYDAIKKVIDDMKGSNEMTAQSVLDAVNAVAKKYGMTLSWDTASGQFVKRNSTGTGVGGEASGLLVVDGTDGKGIFKFEKKWDADDSGVLASVKNALEKYAKGEEITVNNYKYTYNSNRFYYTTKWDSSKGEYKMDESDVRVDPDEITNFYGTLGSIADDAAIEAGRESNKNYSFGIIALSVTESTATKAGSVDLTVAVAYDGNTTYVPLSFALPLAISADEQLAKAKPFVEAFLATYALKNTGGSDYEVTQEILKAVREELRKNPEFGAIEVAQQLKYGTDPVDLKNDKDGKKVTGTIVLKAGDKSENVAVNVAYTTDLFAAATQIAKNVIATWEPKYTEAQYKAGVTADQVRSDLEVAIREALDKAEIPEYSKYKIKDTVNDLVITAPTNTVNGSIIGQVFFTDGEKYALLDANIVIGKNIDPNELLKQVKDVVEARLATYVATNDTTEDDILAVAQAALNEYANNNGVSGLKAVKDSFTLTKATQDAEGSIKGAVTISYGGVVEVANFDITIAKIGADIDVPKVVKSDKFTSTTDAIRINWTTVQDADGYRVYVKQANGEYKSVKTLGKGDVNTYRISGLVAGTEYTYKVKAFKRTEDGTPVWGAASDPIVAATRPLATTVTKNTATKDAVRINWVSVYGADGYKVQQYKNGEWVTIKLTSDTTYRISGLNANTSYRFRVQAFKRVGNTKTYSAWSNTWIAATKK